MAESFDVSYGSANLDFIEAIYEEYQTDPSAVDPHWRAYFEGQGATPEPMPVDADNEQTGTYDIHVHADPHPIIHRAEPINVDEVPEDIRAFFSRVSMFSELNPAGIAALAVITQEVEYPRGRFLCRHGERHEALYFIREGQVSIQKDGREITYLIEGEMVGELAVFDSRPRSADIICKTDCSLLKIDRNDLINLLHQQQDVSLGLLVALSARLRDTGDKQERLDTMVRAFRERGHLAAELDPLGLRERRTDKFVLERWGFSDQDLDTKFTVHLGREIAGRSLRNIYTTLQNVYCKHIGAQFTHIDNHKIQSWIRTRLEEDEGAITLNRDDQVRILKKLTDAEVFESFLHKRFVGAKRFSLEGGESLIPLLDCAIEEAGRHKLDEIVIGMAHRGRLNVLVNILNKPARQVFREFQDVDSHLHLGGKGDVKYHLGYGSNHTTSSGHPVHLSLCFNPSHLEFVNPVAMGRTRAKQDRFGDVDKSRAMPLLIHGDAAFIGQGVNQEMFNLSELPGYATGGTVHVILNNQIGFTTDPEEARTSQYSTDIARMLQIPVFHVNGEHPEAVAFAIRLAMDFRQEFKKDVVIDMYCYRKYGHNEGDDPSFTQPLMYQAIKKRKSVRKAYIDNLTTLKDHITTEEAEHIAEASRKALEEDFTASKADDFEYQSPSANKGLWSAYHGGEDTDETSVTGVDRDTLVQLLHKLAELPKGFTPNNKIKRFLDINKKMAAGEVALNWGACEALALATLLTHGAPVRITGQDAERGTFSHRHAVLHDGKTNQKHAPLNHLSDDQAVLSIHNSPLSEIAVLGFEYGYSLDTPNGLTIWEAQFGDFCNVAQVIIDQFITSSEEKWRRLSGLVMLLPHGFEGQGPEHSSARLERFLMQCAVDNIQVVNMTTPAQLFHCLRRQVVRPMRKPLIVMSPKSLLRHPKAVSTLEELSDGHFQKIIPDVRDLDTSKVRRVLLCSGKVYYELEERREKQGIDDVALLRMEQYYPLPDQELKAALSAYPKEVEVVWVQEEPLNMGAWPFLRLRFGHTVEGNGTHPLNRVTRPESASPATGSAASHKLEQEALLSEAFA